MEETEVGTKPDRASAVAPKRARGKLRVAAILNAGAAVFAEKGYDAATMTEIAARSTTAIGSLYRFFPTKAALADVLLAQYMERLNQGLDSLIEAAPELSAERLARALVDLMLDMRLNRDGVLAAMDGRDDQTALRKAIREGMLSRLTTLLMRVTGKSAERSRTIGLVLQQLLKSVGNLTVVVTSVAVSDSDQGIHQGGNVNRHAISHAENSTLANDALDELRRLIVLYLQSF